MNLGYWAGTVPLKIGVGEVIPADAESQSLPIPESIKRFIERHQAER